MRYTRREFIKAAGGFVCAYTLSPNLLEANQTVSTNILFLITDQHHHGVLGCSGNPLVKTPYIDRLASQGARFTNAVCATPFCSPTRASFVTGQWPHTHGIVRNIEKGDVGLKDDVVACEQILFDKGYCTRQMGKWHLGNVRDLRCYNNDEEDTVSQQTYHKWLRKQPVERWHKPREGDAIIDDAALTPEMAKLFEVWSKEKNRSAQNLAYIGRSLCPPEYTFESWLAERCIELIKKYKNGRFMITYSVSPPHPCWVVPEPYYSMYDPAKIQFSPNFTHRPEAYKNSQPARIGQLMSDDLFREYLRCYYGLVTMVDDCIGRILDALKAEGLEKNTLVVFTSDHGDMQAGHRMVGKSLPTFYEEIVRVPLIIRYPGHIKPGTVINTHAASVDLMPTFLDYAGVKIPKSVQGISLRPLLEGKIKENDRPAFCERGLGDKGSFSRMIRTKKWKYCVFADGRRELFNLEKDPWETNDLGMNSAYKDIKQNLHKQLIEHMEATKDPALAKLGKA
ncbi:MAG: sulfatase-like hydrolase/transferase [Armatimonadetes bacterium]|nr:sulfatase-like hydrolase/transferase [Armatimonadota bacterium]